jgi:hypothetical protein
MGMTAGNLHDWSGRQVVPRLALAAVLLVTAVSGAAVANEAWRCVAGAVTAYREDLVTRQWKTLVFPVGDQRFLVRRAASGHWELVREVGEPAALPCPGDFDAAGRLRCGTRDQFEMNRNTLMFESHLFGAESASLNALTAATAAGTCTAL